MIAFREGWIKGGIGISNIISVIPNDDFTLLIEFEHGNKVLFNMKQMINSIPYNALNNLECFKKLRIEEKAISWDAYNPNTVIPLRLTVDHILFTIRD